MFETLWASVFFGLFAFGASAFFIKPVIERRQQLEMQIESLQRNQETLIIVTDRLSRRVALANAQADVAQERLNLMNAPQPPEPPSPDAMVQGQ